MKLHKGSLDSMERATMEWATMPNDPVPHQLIATMRLSLSFRKVREKNRSGM